MAPLRSAEEAKAAAGYRGSRMCQFQRGSACRRTWKSPKLKLVGQALLLDSLVCNETAAVSGTPPHGTFPSTMPELAWFKPERKQAEILCMLLACMKLLLLWQPQVSASSSA